MKYQRTNDGTGVGREFQHLEDLVFVEGIAGAQFAVTVLESLAMSTNGVTVKWDGNPTIYWGRNHLGKFVLVNKNAWGRVECNSPDMLREFITNSGNKESWRKIFAESLIDIWTLLESATPHWIRGYAYGDLLFYPNDPATITNKSIEFTPNKVKYCVDLNTPLGTRLLESKVCIAAHSMFNNFGDKHGLSITHNSLFKSKDVVVLSQTAVNGSVTVDQEKLEIIKRTIAENSKNIDCFLAPVVGLSDMKNIIYTYVNQISKANRLAQLEHLFVDWLTTSRVSNSKKSKILAIIESNPTALPALFFLVKEIMSVKNSIIEQLDFNNTEIAASTLGEAGGEGYIMLEEKLKLVPRHRWRRN